MTKMSEKYSLQGALGKDSECNSTSQVLNEKALMRTYRTGTEMTNPAATEALRDQRRLPSPLRTAGAAPPHPCRGQRHIFLAQNAPKKLAIFETSNFSLLSLHFCPKWQP